MRILFLSLLAGALTTGCTHYDPPYHVAVPVPTAPPLSGDSLDAIRYPGIYKAYSIGRRIDPQDPRILYEGGPVYVRENPESWNLHPQPMRFLIGPTNAGYAPLSASEGLSRELNSQQKPTKILLNQAAPLNQAANPDPQTQGREHWVTTTERLRLLEERLRQSHSPPASAIVPTNPAPAGR